MDFGADSNGGFLFFFVEVVVVVQGNRNGFSTCNHFCVSLSKFPKFFYQFFIFVICVRGFLCV